MIDVSELTLAFIDRRPAAAARIIAGNPGEDAVAFISAIPTRYACKILANLNAQLASGIVRQLDTVAGTAIIRDSGFVHAAAMLRQLERVERETLLSGLPQGQRLRFHQALNFDPSSVGARMTAEIYLLSTTDTCSSALQAIKSDPTVPCEVIFLQDQNQKYQGTVRLLNVLQRPGHMPLIDLVEDTAVALSVHAGIKNVAKLTAWIDFAALPVVSRRGIVVGALQRRSLTSNEAVFTKATGVQSHSLFRETLFAMTHGIVGLLGLFTAPASISAQLGESSER